MSIAQLFFKKGNFISTVELDIIITETASATARVTENPVENGANVNDHIIIEPMTFTTAGVVSNIGSTLVGQFSRVASIFTQNTTKSTEAWEALLELQANRIPFTLVQGLKEYPNVVILSLAESQDKDTSRGLFFTATMKEIIFVGAPSIIEEIFNDEAISDKMISIIEGGLKQLKEAS